jgi:hypothetical protein
MSSLFKIRGYLAECAPNPQPDGRFAAQVMLTKIGFHPEKAFRDLDPFNTEQAAIAHARRFAEEWLERKA